jgi:hypothetical protein
MTDGHTKENAGMTSRKKDVKVNIKDQIMMIIGISL